MKITNTQRKATGGRSRLDVGPYLGPYLNRRGGVSVPVRNVEHGNYAWAVVSVEDYALAMSRRWKLDTWGYPCCHVWDESAKKSVMLYLHRLVARAPAHLQVDHRKHDLLDCRRKSLRLATPSQNSANTRRFKRGHSRYRGVTLHKQTGKYQAAAKYMGRCLYLGLYDREEAAALAYNAKARKLWGRFATLNNVEQIAESRSGWAA